MFVSAGTAAIVLLMLFVAPPTASAASTRFVSQSGDDTNNTCLNQNNPCGSINHAISEAAAGDTIHVAPGTYVEHVVIDKNIKLNGSGQANTFISGTQIVGSSLGRSVKVKHGVTATISNIVITGGVLTTENGAGIRNAGKLTLDHVKVFSNITYASAQSGDGGGIYNTGILIINSSSIFTNTAQGEGGGIFNKGHLTIDSSTITSNHGASGGGIANTGTAKITNSSVEENTGGLGGGVFSYFGSITLKKVVFTHNTASDLGGGLYNGDTATLRDVTFQRNQAQSSGGFQACGGGIGNFGSLDLLRVTFYINSAQDNGGTIDNLVGSAKLVNVTLNENKATAGGGIFNGDEEACTTTLTNVTVDQNLAHSGGALLNQYGTITVKNTIIEAFFSPPVSTCSGTITSKGHNLVYGSDNCGLDASLHDILGADPLLKPLADNGGFTQTQALEHYPHISPAIDKGTKIGCPDADQRGVARPQDGDGDGKAHCDIGAFEVKP
jgi:hypothetical protein